MKRLQNLLRNRMSRTLLAAGLAATAIFLWGCSGYLSGTYVGAEVSYASDDMEYLSQYGDWIEVEPYGMVWHPNVIAGWEPFQYGHWDWTDDGWAWVSYEPYGWLVYHYGYWDYQPTIGWFWISGDQWSPARVDWITYGGFIGWAPLPPPGVIWPEPWVHFDVGVWNVVPIRDFDRDDIRKYRIVRPPRVGEMHQAEIHHGPPEVQVIEQRTGRRIPRVPIERRSMNMTFRQPERRGHEGEVNRGQGEHRQPEQGQTAGRGERERGRDHEAQRMVLPKREQKRVEQHRRRVEREVLRPHHENRGQGEERGRGHERGRDGDQGGGHR